MAVTPSPISGLRLALRLRRLVGAVWLVSMAVFLPAHLVAELAAGATRAGLPDRPLPPGDSITFNGDLEECVFVLSGEVEQASAGEASRLLRPRNTLTRPVCLATLHIFLPSSIVSVSGFSQ